MPSGSVNRTKPCLAANLFLAVAAGFATYTPNLGKMVYPTPMGRTNIEINDRLIRQARKLTRLKTKRQIVDKALELLVRTETRKGILAYFGTDIWQGDLKASRRNRV
jgi:Arc/MetJ family transcription regulator